MVDPIPPDSRRPSVPATTATICPFLLADDGAWRSATATRAHRCAAVTPPAVLSPDKQRRLCLTIDHGGCATFVAARAVRTGADRPTAARQDRPTARPLTRTAPLVLDHGRLAMSPRVGTVRLDRSVGQLALIVLMVLAFAAILFARLAGGDGAGGVAGATGTPGASVPAGTPSSGATDAPGTPTVAPTQGGSVAPTGLVASDPPSASPDGPGTTYVVRSGDTLYGIATEFGTTWQVIADLNGIEDPGRIRVGQELLIP